MGRVFVGENLLTGKLVALKCLLNSRTGSDEQLLRFRVEARAAGRIDHPNVIQVYDVLEDAGRTFLVMEKLTGEPLAELLDRERRLPVVDAVAITLEAMRGLSAAHGAGVIHRDIKPANIFLCTGSAGVRVKVLDFGVSKLIDLSGMDITRTGAFVGTPHYMAPEQVRGMLDLDHRIDVYSLGAMLYEMLVGSPPFAAANFTSLLVEIATADYLPVSVARGDTSHELDAVMARALARNRDHRYPDVETFARELESFGDGTEFRPTGPDWTGRVRQTPASSNRGPKSSVRASSRAPTQASDDVLGPSLVEVPAFSREPGPPSPSVSTDLSSASASKSSPLMLGVLVVAVIAATAYYAMHSPEGDDTGAVEAAEVEPAEVEPAEASEVEAAQVEPEGVPEAAEPEALEVEPPAVADTEAESETTMQRGLRLRRGSRPETPTEMRSTHRAGELTLEDF